MLAIYVKVQQHVPQINKKMLIISVKVVLIHVMLDNAQKGMIKIVVQNVRLQAIYKSNRQQILLDNVYNNVRLEHLEYFQPIITIMVIYVVVYVQPIKSQILIIFVNFVTPIVLRESAVNQKTQFNA